MTIINLTPAQNERLAFVRRWLSDLQQSGSGDADLIDHLRRCEADILRQGETQ
jgi:hypothetical protein